MPDVFQMLEQDHRQVQDLLAQIERTSDASERQRIFERVKNELHVHSRFEEEKFYPSARRATGMDEEIEDDLEEHEEADLLLDRISEMDASSDEWLEHVRELHSTLDHHIHDEEDRLFPQARKKFNTAQIESMGAEYESRKNRPA